jgi:hypothetical protein
MYTSLTGRTTLYRLRKVRSSSRFTRMSMAHTCARFFSGGWKPGFAAYTKMRDNFDVREPYPLPPFPAPNSQLRFAKKLPPGKLLIPGQELPPLPPFPPLPPLPGLGVDREDDREEGGSRGVGTGASSGRMCLDYDQAEGSSRNRRRDSVTQGSRSPNLSPGPSRRSETLLSTRPSQTPSTDPRRPPATRHDIEATPDPVSHLLPSVCKRRL